MQLRGSKVWAERSTGKSFCFIGACARFGCQVGFDLKRSPALHFLFGLGEPHFSGAAGRVFLLPFGIELSRKWHSGKFEREVEVEFSCYLSEARWNRCKSEVNPKNTDVNLKWNRSGIQVSSTCRRSHIEAQSKWNRSEIEAISKWVRRGLEVRPKRVRSYFEVNSKWRRSDVEGSRFGLELESKRTQKF